MAFLIRVLRGLIFAVLIAGCGYQTHLRRDEPPRALRIPPIRETVVDLDVGAMVQRALHGAAGRIPGLVLVSEETPAPALETELVGVRTGLSTFAEPALRAAQYRVVVELQGRLVDLDGRVFFSSALIHGEAPFYSTAGRIEVLDGAARRALESASDQAADRLMTIAAEVLRTHR